MSRKIKKGRETIYRRDRGIEWNTLKKEAQDREEYREWINGLKLKGIGTIYRGDRGKVQNTLK